MKIKLEVEIISTEAIVTNSSIRKYPLNQREDFRLHFSQMLFQLYRLSPRETNS